MPVASIPKLKELFGDNPLLQLVGNVDNTTFNVAKVKRIKEGALKGGISFTGSIEIKGSGRSLGSVMGNISSDGKVKITNIHGYEFSLPEGQRTSFTPGRGGRPASQMFGFTGVRNIMREIVKLAKKYGIKVKSVTGTRVSGMRELAGKSSWETKVGGRVGSLGEVMDPVAGKRGLPPKSPTAAQIFRGRIPSAGAGLHLLKKFGSPLKGIGTGGGGGALSPGGKIKTNPIIQ